ncbi:MAG: lipoyl(octanoyl) transferase LipB [Clostridium sp.]|nr:lipoyl(octanoyl) transferase LipB [Clostridium sp.]
MIEIRDLHTMPYREAWALQKILHEELKTAKKEGRTPSTEYLLLTEHPAVLTMGKHAHRENLLATEQHLQRLGIECIPIERGGDITYHGPGQLVGYPIIDLEKHHLGVKDYVHLIEETVIRTILPYGIKGERVEGASGVWIDAGTPRERKICALGVKCSRFVTMHGLALNVNTNMSGFSLINPCGFIDKGVTSMQMELGESIDFDKVKFELAEIFIGLLKAGI